MASDPRAVPLATVVYYRPLRKYFVMEDLCASCVDRWSASKTPHVDLWVGATTDPNVTSCESALTPDGLVTVEINPPPDLPVDTGPLYENGRCAAR